MVKLCCPKCLSRLSLGDCEYSCENCAEVYPVVLGVPVLVAGTTVTKGAAPSSSFAQCIVNSGPSQELLPVDANEQIREAFSTYFEFKNQVIQSESSQFLSRLRSSGVEVEDFVQQAKGRTIYPTAHGRGGARVSGRIVTFPPESLVAGQNCSFNVQISNIGQEVLSSTGDRPFHISYTLIDKKGRRTEGVRTKLLIDLLPGRSITQPLRFACPSVPGTYRLCLQPLIEDVEWLSVVDEKSFDVRAHARKMEIVGEFTGVQRNYSDDHLAALSFLKDRISPTDTIVEIGGNYRPTAALTGNPVVNIDVDPYGLMASKILYSGIENVTHVVADGTCLPFPDQQADVVAMFATFHHFPDPVALLKHLRSKMAKSGKLFLLCEPVGHHFAENTDEGYIKELASGAYEQSFLPWEYAQLLSAGGFSVADAIFDVGSVKILAVPTNTAPRENYNRFGVIRRLFSRSP